MNEKPILFSGEMVRAIIGGRKSQTRRIVRIDDTPITAEATRAGKRQRGIPLGATNVRMLGSYLKCDAPPGSMTVSSRVECPHGEIGDRLWVRESFIHHPAEFCIEASVSFPSAPAETAYRADYANPERCGWTPSIHMPRKLSRITLEITRVRAERLQDITEEDARAEGVSCRTCGHPIDGLSENDCECFHSVFARVHFKALWNRINGERPGCSWDANPWVWVLDFRVVGKVAA